MAAAIGGDVALSRPGEAGISTLAGLDLLVVGAPVHGGRPMPSVQAFLDRLPALQGLRVAVFDTRLTSRLVKVFGYAADRAAASLKDKGAILVGAPEGFLVTGKRGPLKEGELEKAAAWARSLLELMR
jgi:flavodoxin